MGMEGVELIPVSVNSISTVGNLRTFFDEVKPYLREYENVPEETRRI